MYCDFYALNLVYDACVHFIIFFCHVPTLVNHYFIIVFLQLNNTMNDRLLLI